MLRRTILLGLTAAAALAVGETNAFAQSTGIHPPSMHHQMGGMGQGMSHGMMGVAHDSATMAQMRIIHELFINHDRIRRTVTALPDGIRALTESDDPRIAQLLKAHVASMRERVDTGNDPGLPIESESLRSIFRNHDRIRTTVETTDKGVVVVQTSTDPETVVALQQHASEVTDFVKEGMAAMRTVMMRHMRGTDSVMHNASTGHRMDDGR